MGAPPTGLFITGVADELYEPCLIALIEALDLVGNSHWHAWMVDDLERWRRRRDVAHHRSAYGGMGSFNDLWFSSGDAWIDETAETLREAMDGISATVAREPTRIVQLPVSVTGSVYADRCAGCAATLLPERAFHRSAASAWASWWVPTCLRERRPSDICAGAKGDVPARRDDYLADARLRLQPDWYVVGSIDAGAPAEPCPRCGSTDHTSLHVALY